MVWFIYNNYKNKIIVVLIHKEQILYNVDTGFIHMLDNHKYEDLTNLFKLFKFNEKNLEVISKALAEYISKKGNLLKEKKEIKEKPELYGQQITEFQNEINSMIEKCFENNEMILSKSKSIFNEDFMNNEKKKKKIE